jgi:fumarylacetoacetase
MPSITSWLDIPADSDFSLHNLPYGIYRTAERPQPQAATRLGDTIIDLGALQRLGYFDGLGLPLDVFDQPHLNDFIALGPPTWQGVRSLLMHLFDAAKNLGLRDHESHRTEVLIEAHRAEMLMPVVVRDYTDFYASEYHATNVGTMFRGKDSALMPNWKHLPVGYHGRASSIVVSGTPIRRPMGQLKPEDGDPVYGPSRLLDFELEVAFIVGASTELGEQVPIDKAEDHIFGLVLFNDWSARDIQKWEYVPLGPFLGKSFGSSISPWIVPLAALEPFRTAGPPQAPKVLPYLAQSGPQAFDLALEVSIAAPGQPEHRVCQSNFKHLYWSMAQQLAHHTVNGCNLNVGDMMASGTISGPAPGSYGSMLEITWRGSQPLEMPDGSTRTFIQDGDTVIMRGHAGRDGIRVGFGEVHNRVLPARQK